MVEVLVHCSKDSVKDAATEAAKPAAPGETGEMQVGETNAQQNTHKTYIDVTRLTVTLIFFQVVPVMLHLLTSISSVRLYIPKDLRPFDNRQLMLKSIQVQDVAILNTKKWHSWNWNHDLNYCFFASKHFVCRRYRNVFQMAFLCSTPSMTWASKTLPWRKLFRKWRPLSTACTPTPCTATPTWNLFILSVRRKLWWVTDFECVVELKASHRKFCYTSNLTESQPFNDRPQLGLVLSVFLFFLFFFYQHWVPFVRWPSFVSSCQTGRLWPYTHTNTGRQKGHYSYTASPSVIGLKTKQNVPQQSWERIFFFFLPGGFNSA